jgi:hypothetical protein
MYRTAGALLIYTASLMPVHGVYAASENPQATNDRGVVSRNANGYGSGKKVKLQNIQEKKMASKNQATGLRDVAMRSPAKGMEAGEAAVPRIEKVADSSSWFSMLIAGLGVALISIFRRIGGLS